MTKPTVTEQMVEAAMRTFYSIDRTTPADITEAHTHAITAAIEASGLMEENARLRNGIEGLANIIRDSIKESDGPDRVWLDGVAYEGPLVDHYFKILHAIQTTFDLLLNKEPTP